MASIGPLESFVFPGVLTQTRVQDPLTAGGGQLRYPALIGVGQETDSVDAEMIRGSSATAVNVIVGEDLEHNGKSGNVVDGVNTLFQTALKPLVKNQAVWAFATSPEDVVVTVNSEKVQVQSVDGVNGIVTLSVAPEAGDLVEIAYYYKRHDTFVEAEELTLQVGSGNKNFRVKSPRIVDGSNGGTTLASFTSSSVTVLLDNGQSQSTRVFKVVDGDGVELAVTSVSGASRSFELVDAPTGEVFVSYFTNDYQNTYDILPAATVLSVESAGNSIHEKTWIGEKDWVLAKSNRIYWGTAAIVEAGASTTSTVLGDNQITATLIDNRVYNERLNALPLTAPTKSFTLKSSPVRGDGLDTPLTDPLNGTTATWDDLKVYSAWSGLTGSAAIDATYTGFAGTTGVAELTVATVDGTAVTTVETVDAGLTVWATYYQNKLADNTWTITNTLAGVQGVGEYTVRNTGTTPSKVAYQTTYLSGLTPGDHVNGVTFLDQADTNYDGTANDTINAFMPPSSGAARNDETVVVTIAAADVDGNQTFVVTGTGTGSLTGSVTPNIGAVGTTYVDPATGFTISLAYAPAAGGVIRFRVSSTFVAQGILVPELGAPGIQFTVANTTGVGVGDNASVTTINMMNADEPAVGDPYQVSFTRARTDYSIKYLVNLADARTFYGDIYTGNPLMIAVALAFQNGAPAVAVKQLKKNSLGVDANVSDYLAAIDLFDEPLSNGTRPALLQPLSTHPTVVGYLKTSNSKQSSIRYRNERTSFFGFSLGTVMETVMSTCKGLATEFLTAVYPDSARITVKNAAGEAGVDTQINVNGAYLAVAMAGLDTNPAYDVATPLTNKTLSGFNSIGRVVKNTDAQLIASSGCTMLAQNGPGVLKILMALTTDVSGPLTRDPRIIEIKHEIQKGARIAVDPFIGVKGLPNVPGQVASVMTNFFQSKKNAQIVYAYQGIKAEYDAADPTVINVEAYYRPVFGVNWIVITFNITTSLG